MLFHRMGLAAVLGLALWLPAREAEACGGTFCDIGPNTSPVDQASETVLFVQDGAFVEAHIQIAIDPSTTALKFAWLVPMPAVPEFQVGSQPLFDALLAASGSRYEVTGDYCSNDDTGVAFIQNPDGGGANHDPEVHVETVGAFEVSVLQGGTVAGVMAWLGDNGYQQDPAAEPILQSYLDLGHVLVAFRLIPSADIAEVHPIVLRYAGDEPCVPIRLTAIAAAQDMGVRVFMLGDTRFGPVNYQHVVPNVLRAPWGRDGNGYAAAISMAVDVAEGGHGFVTEYAGPSEGVSIDGIYAASWDASVFADAEAIDVVTRLNEQGLANCPPEGPCLVPHPLVVAMLRKYLPAPADVGENQFYECLSCYADQTDFAAWDGPAFAAELQQRVIGPGQHGAALLGAWPYLTRMFTTISPHEMTVDPTFGPTPDLPDVPVLGPATRVCVDCPDDAVATLPDGRMVYLEDSNWPGFGDAMPWVERIEELPPNGAPIVVIDERASIDAALAEWNDAHECMLGGGSGGGSDGGSSSGGATGGGGEGVGGSDGSSGVDPGQSESDAAKGCACGPGGGVKWSAIAAPLLVLGWGRRRR